MTPLSTVVSFFCRVRGLGMLTDDWDYVQNAVSGFGALPKAIQSYIEIRVNTKYIHVVFRFFMSQKTFCTV